MCKHVLQLVLHNHHAEFVRRVDYPYDDLSILVIVFPHVSVFTLPAHIKHREIDVLVVEFFNLETDGRHNFKRSNLHRSNYFEHSPKLSIPSWVLDG